MFWCWPPSSPSADPLPEDLVPHVCSVWVFFSFFFLANQELHWSFTISSCYCSVPMGKCCRPCLCLCVTGTGFNNLPPLFSALHNLTSEARKEFRIKLARCQTYVSSFCLDHFYSHVLSSCSTKTVLSRFLFVFFKVWFQSDLNAYVINL